MKKDRAPFYSVIIPVLDEEQYIRSSIQSVRKTIPGAEVLVVDGGSRDRTCEYAGKMADRLIHSAQGRGHQCHNGALAAEGEVLLFLHGDTIISSGAELLLDRFFRNRKGGIALFRLGFDKPHPVLWFYSLFTNFDSLFTSFGDRCISIRRDLYFSLGGFPGYYLYEDVELLRRARKRGPIKVLRTKVITSSRMFRDKGYILRTLKNGFIFLRYLTGTSSHRLYRQYYRGSFRK